MIKRKDSRHYCLGSFLFLEQLLIIAPFCPIFSFFTQNDTLIICISKKKERQSFLLSDIFCNFATK